MIILSFLMLTFASPEIGVPVITWRYQARCSTLTIWHRSPRQASVLTACLGNRYLALLGGYHRKTVQTVFHQLQMENVADKWSPRCVCRLWRGHSSLPAMWLCTNQAQCGAVGTASTHCGPVSDHTIGKSCLLTARQLCAQPGDWKWLRAQGEMSGRRIIHLAFIRLPEFLVQSPS